MLFQHVAIAGLAHIDAPHALSSADINAQLKPTMDRLGIKTDVLQDIAGIFSRRMWDAGVQSSDAATLAAEKALTDAGVEISYDKPAHAQSAAAAEFLRMEADWEAGWLLTLDKVTEF